MSMFDNVVLDEFTLLEGKQADAYRKKKQRSEEASGRNDMKRMMSYSYDRASKDEQKYEKDIENKMAKNKRFKKASDEAEKASRGGGDNGKQDFRKVRDAMYAADAIDRHDRRHKKASTKAEAVNMLIAGFESEYNY